MFTPSKQSLNICSRVALKLTWWNSSQYRLRACHDISQRPVYSLFTAAALFYLDIPHKNSIELCSAGCSLAAFEDEIFSGVFSGQRPTNLTVHMKRYHNSKQYLQCEVVLCCFSLWR